MQVTEKVKDMAKVAKALDRQTVRQIKDYTTLDPLI